uniref:SET domain-containing protein n=1 Tax=Schistocephalus solidus TaxID=70667 RepID=A0A183TJS3_SCHSO
LDYIETIEKPKEDYEPYAIEPPDSFDEYECASPASLPISSHSSRRNGGRRRRRGRPRRKSSSSPSSVSSSSRSSSFSIASSCVSCASSSCPSIATPALGNGSEVIELDPIPLSSPGVDLDAIMVAEPPPGGKPPASLPDVSKRVKKADLLKPPQERETDTATKEVAPQTAAQEVQLQNPNLVQMTVSLKIAQANDSTTSVGEADPQTPDQETLFPKPNPVKMTDSLKHSQQNGLVTPVDESYLQETPLQSPHLVQMTDFLKLSRDNDISTSIEEILPPNATQEATSLDPSLLQEANSLMNASQENYHVTPIEETLPSDAAQETSSSNSVQGSDPAILDQQPDAEIFVTEGDSAKSLVQKTNDAAAFPLLASETATSASNTSSERPDSPVSESRASTAEEEIAPAAAPPSPPEMTRMETSPPGNNSPSLGRLLENQLAELEPTISGLLANSRLLVPAFSTTAPGLSDCTGISNLREVLAEAAFNRLPFVRLSPLQDPMPVRGDSHIQPVRRRSLRSSNADPKPPSVRPLPVVQPSAPLKTRDTRLSPSTSRKLASVDHTQPRILLRINLRKTASAVLGRSSSTSSLASLSTKSVDHERRYVVILSSLFIFFPVKRPDCFSFGTVYDSFVITPPVGTTPQMLVSAYPSRLCMVLDISFSYRSSLSSESRREPSKSRGGSRRSTSSRRANEQPSRGRQGHQDHHHQHHQHHHQQQQSQSRSRNYIASASSSPAPPPTWANRRAYPIARKDWLLARSYFGDESPYVMDAKKMGNLGRYFNHSCNPNVFVQNVFIDTHDPRFPEVAFFAKRNIAAGEEMTWDYGYVVDAVPFKVLYCYCGEPSCRIRLL